MSNQESLILFLVDKHPSLNNIYPLMLLLNRVDLRIDVYKSLQKLIDLEYIEEAEHQPPKEMPIYRTNMLGKAALKSYFDKNKILEYIQTRDKPKSLFELYMILVNKK